MHYSNRILSVNFDSEFYGTATNLAFFDSKYSSLPTLTYGNEFAIMFESDSQAWHFYKEMLSWTSLDYGRG